MDVWLSRYSPSSEEDPLQEFRQKCKNENTTLWDVQSSGLILDVVMNHCKSRLIFPGEMLSLLGETTINNRFLSSSEYQKKRRNLIMNETGNTEGFLFNSVCTHQSERYLGKSTW